MSKQKMSTQALVFAAFAVVLNLVGGYITQATKIPLLFLDSVGTIFSAVLFGPWVGGLVGVASNLVLGVISSPTNIPFALVNLMIGLVVGFIARKWDFSLPVAIGTGLLLAVASPLVGTPIAVAMFGGLTGSGLDLFVIWLKAAGNGIFTAAFLPRITGNLVDKIASCILVYALVKAMPESLTGRFRNRAA